MKQMPLRFLLASRDHFNHFSPWLKLRDYCKIPHLWCFALDRKKNWVKQLLWVASIISLYLISIVWVNSVNWQVYLDCIFQHGTFCASAWLCNAKNEHVACLNHDRNLAHFAALIMFGKRSMSARSWHTPTEECEQFTIWRKKLRQHSQSKLSQTIHSQRIISILYIIFSPQIGTA